MAFLSFGIHEKVTLLENVGRTDKTQLDYWRTHKYGRKYVKEHREQTCVNCHVSLFFPQNFMSLLNHKLIARCSKCDTNSFVRCHVGRDHVQNLIFHTLRAIGNEMECENFQFDRYVDGVLISFPERLKNGILHFWFMHRRRRRSNSNKIAFWKKQF